MAEALRHLPYDIEVEQALLGALIKDNKLVDRVSGMLRGEHFYEGLHERIYALIEQQVAAGTTITPLTLAAAMKADPAWAQLEIPAHVYFATLVQMAPSLPNVRELAKVLVELAGRRELTYIAEDLAQNAHKPPHEMPLKTAIEEAEKALYRVSETRQYGNGALDFAESLRRAVESAEKAQQRGGRISGVTSGFVDIDNLLGGLQPSDLLILAGRPGMGKTALATNMAMHAARAYLRDLEAGAEAPAGAAILFFSLEMAAQQLAQRILSEQTEIEMWKIRNGRFNETEWEKFVLATQELASIPLYIDDTGGISIAQISARARRLQREKKIGCVMIDHIQLVSGAGRTENRTQELTEISKGLKVLAKDLNVPVVALSQLSRAVDSRDDKRPVLSDLRESGSIEQDADVVMFVYREEYYLATREPEPGSNEHVKWCEKLDRAAGKAEVLIEKHRHGATKRIDLQFDARFTRFSNLADR